MYGSVCAVTPVPQPAQMIAEPMPLPQEPVPVVPPSVQHQYNPIENVRIALSAPELIKRERVSDITLMGPTLMTYETYVLRTG